ncbi:MAG: ABC transporter ATP-binding protein [Faecalibacterium sp.]
MDYNADEQRSKVSTLSTWKKLLPFIKPHRALMLWLGLAMLICACIDVATPWMSGLAVEWFILPRTTEGLGLFALACFALVILQGVATYAMAVFALKIEMRLGRDLRNTMYRHLQTLSFDYYNTTPVGTILARVMSDTGKIGIVFAWSVVDIVWSGAVIIGSIVVMCLTNLKLALVIIAIVPFVLALTFIFQRKILKTNREVRRVNAEITRTYNEGISGAKTSKTLVIEDANSTHFETITKNMRETSLRALTLSAIYVPCVSFLTSIAVAFVLSTGGNEVLLGAIGIAEFTVFINYARNIADPTAQMAKTLSNIIAAQVNIERCDYLLSLKPQVTDTPEVVEQYGDVFTPKTENWEPLKGHITFEDVTFMYSDGNENVLEHFNLDIPAGTTVAIVGETGAGKSTLVNLACRFFEPTSGRVLIDGVDYRKRSTLWLHWSIGYVLQTPHLFSGSVMENIRYGRLDATDDEVIAAAKTVCAHDFIMQMEKGYASEVGEGGGQLSTGEKQLISFARAVLAAPKIFVLDEATASIDTKTEETIQAAIAALLAQTTSFLIAHRLSTIRKADIILVVKQGKIIERGTHAELLAQQGHYAALYRKQFEQETTRKILEG